MIPSSAPFWQGNQWKKTLAESIKEPQELFSLLGLPNTHLPTAIQISKIFPLKVTRSFLSRMQYGNLNDPLLLQVLPWHLENQQTPGYHCDPVGDLAASRVPGLIHKYYGRVLLVTTGACAVHCRYCFRRHFPYSKYNPANNNWQAAMDYIRSDTTIEEVILSGGDPLTLNNQKLIELAQRIAKIPQVTTLRMHSRLPIVLPERITQSFLTALGATGLRLVMVVHANHANEINDEVCAAVRQMRKNNMVVLNQSVLLHKVNDNAADLALLSKKLFSNGVLPYYLHVLDKVQGAAHFSVSPAKIQRIYSELCKQLPGYMVPKLVTEHAGAEYKLPIFAPADIE